MLRPYHLLLVTLLFLSLACQSNTAEKESSVPSSARKGETSSPGSEERQFSAEDGDQQSAAPAHNSGARGNRGVTIPPPGESSVHPDDWDLRDEAKAAANYFSPLFAVQAVAVADLPFPPDRHEIQSAVAWDHPDGPVLFLAGDTQDGPLMLLYDEEGRVKKKVELGFQPTALYATADGKYAIVQGASKWPTRTSLIDLSSGEETAIDGQVEGWIQGGSEHLVEVTDESLEVRALPGLETQKTVPIGKGADVEELLLFADDTRLALVTRTTADYKLVIWDLEADEPEKLAEHELDGLEGPQAIQETADALTVRVGDRYDRFDLFSGKALEPAPVLEFAGERGFERSIQKRHLGEYGSDLYLYPMHIHPVLPEGWGLTIVKAPDPDGEEGDDWEHASGAPSVAAGARLFRVLLIEQPDIVWQDDQVGEDEGFGPQPVMPPAHVKTETALVILVHQKDSRPVISAYRVSESRLVGELDMSAEALGAKAETLFEGIEESPVDGGENGCWPGSSPVQHPDGKTVIIPCGQGLLVWEVENGDWQALSSPDSGEEWPGYEELTISRDGERLLAAGGEKLEVWEWNKKQVINTIAVPTNRDWAEWTVLEFSPDERNVYVANDGVLRRISLADGKLEWKLPTLAGEQHFWDAVPDESGELLVATPDLEPNLAVLDADTGRVLRLDSELGTVTQAGWTPGGRIIGVSTGLKVANPETLETEMHLGIGPALAPVPFTILRDTNTLIGWDHKRRTLFKMTWSH